MSRAAMILAAGFGTRMGTLTQDRPKPLITVAGRPLLDHAVAAAGSADPIVVNAHYKADQIKSYVTSQHSNLLISDETPEILDSAGGIKAAIPLLGPDPILTLNADAVWRGPCPADLLEAAWRPQEMAALLLLVPRERAIGRQGGGDFALRKDGRIALCKTADSYVYCGAQILQTDAIQADPRQVFSLRETWQTYEEEGCLFGLVYPGFWADVGHPQGIDEAEAMLRDD